MFDRPLSRSARPFWILVVCLAAARAPAPAAGQAPPEAEEGGAPDAGATAEDTAPETPAPLRIVAAGNEPFVGAGDPPSTGIALELWRDVAEGMDLEWELRQVDSAQAAVDAVAAGEADVAVGPISITAARAAEVSFTQPWFQGALAIAARTEGETLWQRIRPFATKAFLGGVASLLGVLVLVGLLFWVTERKANPEHFPASPMAGVANGVWLALVTMTTVGYGDRAPVTPAGRIVASVWMVLAMLTASSLTAFLATALTLSQIDAGEVRAVEDLVGRRVAVPAGTTAVGFVRRQGGRVVEVDGIEEGVDRLVAGGVDAVVFDRPALRWHLSQRGGDDVALSRASYEPVGYGFAFPHGSALRPLVNVGLLELSENGVTQRIAEAWLGREDGG